VVLLGSHPAIPSPPTCALSKMSDCPAEGVYYIQNHSNTALYASVYPALGNNFLGQSKLSSFYQQVRSRTLGPATV
jgi:hypothetical protein